jgi:hypothetical protein
MLGPSGDDLLQPHSLALANYHLPTLGQIQTVIAALNSLSPSALKTSKGSGSKVS